MSKRILVIGAGGHAKSVLDALTSCGEYDEIAVLEDFGVKEVLGFKVIGKVSEAEIFLKDYDYAVVAVGNNDYRLKTMNELKKKGFKLPCVIHKTAYLSEYSTVGEGSVLLADSVVNANSKIGSGVIINTAATVDHDCEIDDGVHLSPNCALCGSVHIGKETWIGAGATVIDHINIGEKCIVGAGAVVVENFGNNIKAYGNPAVRH